MTASRRLEAPNERSMHRVPVPVGAGIAVVATALVLLAAVAGCRRAGRTCCCWQCLPGSARCPGSTTAVGSPRPLRFAAQAVAVALCLASLPPEARGVRRSLPVALGAPPRWAWPGCGSSISSTSWTASTGWREARRLPWRSAIWCWRLHRRPRQVPSGSGADRGGVGRGLSVLELASGEGLHGRRRLDPAGLPAGLADAGPGCSRALGRSADPAALFRRPMPRFTLLKRGLRGEKPGRRTASISISARCWVAPRRPGVVWRVRRRQRRAHRAGARVHRIPRAGPRRGGCGRRGPARPSAEAGRTARVMSPRAPASSEA